MKRLSWIAVALIMGAAATITLYPTSAFFPHIFLVFLLGHVLLTIFNYRIKEWSQFSLNFVFIFIDLTGFIIRL